MRAFHKRALSALLALCLIAGLAAPSLAADPVPISAPAILVYANDKAVEFVDAQPQAIDGSQFMLPLRSVMETVGATVGYDTATQQITVTYGETRLAFHLRRSDATVTSTAAGAEIAYSINPAPVNVNGRILVPAGMLSDCFGLVVGTVNNVVTVTDFTGVFEGIELGTYEILKGMEQPEAAYEQTGSFTGDMTVKAPDADEVKLPVSGTLTGLTEGLLANGSATLTFGEIDADLIKAIDSEELQTLAAMLPMLQALDIEYIVDAGAGVLYFKSAAAAVLTGSLEGAENWYRVDLGTGTLPAGDIEAVLIAQAIQAGATAPGQSLAMARYTMLLFSELLSDKAFTNTGTEEAPVYSWVMNNTTMIDAMAEAAGKTEGLQGVERDKEKIKAQLDEQGFVTDIKMTLTPGKDAVEQSVECSLEFKDSTMGTVKMTMKVSAKMPGKETVEMTLSVTDPDGVVMTVSLACEAESKVSDRKPVSAPPEGSVIVKAA